MKPNRGVSNSSLAFIDVMSCGLGAVILLFIILDFNRPSDEIKTPELAPVVTEEVANRRLFEKKQDLIKLSALEDKKIKKLVASLTSVLVESSKKAIQLDASANILLPKRQNAQHLDKPASGELIGLSVTGSRILIAFDTSASMSNEKLIDIIMGLSDSSGARLAAGEKWSQAKRALRWVIRNAPKKSQIQVLGYSDSVVPLTSGWASQADVIDRVSRSLTKLDPIGGTSLGGLLEYIEDRSIMFDSLYIITDGLPTISGEKKAGLAGLKACFSLSKKRNSYVGGECREALYVTAVRQFQKTSRSTVNVILLPLEGDPKAAPLYWAWTNTTNGTLFSPAQGWPPR